MVECRGQLVNVERVLALENNFTISVVKIDSGRITSKF